MRQNSKLTHPERILVAVDEHGESEHAVHAGLELARILDAALEFTHVVPRLADIWPRGGGPLSALRAQEDLEARARLDALRRIEAWIEKTAYRRARGSDLLVVAAGSPARVVLERARRMRADLIVLGGGKQHTGFEFGGTARAVLSGARCAVWVQRTPVGRIDRILAPVDLSDASLCALASAVQLARAFHARVELLHCIQPVPLIAAGWPEPAALAMAWPNADLRAAVEAELAARLRDFDWLGVEHTTLIVEGDPVTSILERAAEHDLVVLGTHGRTGLSRLMLGNTAHSVLRRVTRPALVVRAGASWDDEESGAAS